MHIRASKCFQEANLVFYEINLSLPYSPIYGLERRSRSQSRLTRFGVFKHYFGHGHQHQGSKCFRRQSG